MTKTDSFTHDNHQYDLAKVRVLMRDKETFFLPIKSLEWILEFDIPSEDRIKIAKFRHPLLVTKYKGRWCVIDGIHRLEKYRRKGWKKIPVKFVTPDILNKTKLPDNK